MDIDEAIEVVGNGQDLDESVMESLLSRMLLGQLEDASMASLLIALHAKGESVSELVGAARAMRSQMTPVQTKHAKLLDTCGTGGDGAGTFNISTAAAIVSAAAGAKVAKHGNRKVTSATGSADVLAELGVKIDAPREVVQRCLDELGIGFCFAPLLHPAMRHVRQVRQSLSVPTLFNYLGPLCNPANAAFQVLGVGKSNLQSVMAECLTRLPIERALVVRGEDGMDEFSLMAPTKVIEVQGGSIQRPGVTKTYTLTHENFELDPISVDDILVDGPAESAAMIQQVLDGEYGGPRSIVIANAAAGIWLAGLSETLTSAVQCCSAAIDNGSAKLLVQKLAAMTHA